MAMTRYYHSSVLHSRSISTGTQRLCSCTLYAVGREQQQSYCYPSRMSKYHSISSYYRKREKHATSRVYSREIVFQQDSLDLPPLPVECTRHLTVTLLRHGQSTWNQQSIIQGSSDQSELTEKGKEQASSAAVLLQQLGWDHDFTETWASPLQRARQTAEIVHQCLNRRPDVIRYLYSLREIDLHSFQGMKKKSVQAKTSAAYAAWKKDPATFEIDGHAPVRELWYRASIVWNTLVDTSQENILLVAHNATNQALIHTALGLEPSMFRRIIQSNASLSRLEFLPRETCDEDDSGTIRRQILVHAINRVPMRSMIEKELLQKNLRKVVLVCDGDENTVDMILKYVQEKSVDGQSPRLGQESWTVIDGTGRDEDWIEDSLLKEKNLPRRSSIVMVKDADSNSRLIKRLMGISRQEVTFVSDPGSLTLLTCPETHDDLYTLVCSNYHFMSRSSSFK